MNSGAVSGFIYGAVIIVLSIGAAGAGHGTGIPLLISAAPLSALPNVDMGIVYFAPPLWALLGYTTTLPCKWIPAILFLLHYVSVIVALAVGPGGGAGLGEPIVLFVWLVVYLCGQMLFWRVIRGRGQPQQ